MIITAIESLNKGRRKVFLNDEFAFILYKKEIEELSLKVGDELSGEIYHRIYDEILTKRCKLRAMHILEKRDKTEKQLYEKLLDGDYPEEIVRRAIEYVKSYHYVDDHEYALRYIRGRIQAKSKRVIVMELMAKGITQEDAGRAYDEVADEMQVDETDKLALLIQKRLKGRNISEFSEEEKQKLYRYFLGKGFHYDQIRHSLDITSDLL